VTIHDIVGSLYTDRRVKEFIGLQEPADLREDLLHHCVLEIYRMHEKYPGKIEKLHIDGQMFAFFVGMVKNQNWSEKSTFWSRFKRGHEPEEVYLNNSELIKAEESGALIISQTEQDICAIEKFGNNFMEYFYNTFPNRKVKNKTKCAPLSLQPSLF